MEKKIDRQLLFYAFLVCLLISLFGYMKYQQHKAKQSLPLLSSFLDNELENLKNGVANGSIATLSKNVFLVKVYENDKLIYWNDSRLKPEKSKDLREVFSSSFTEKNKICTFSLLEDKKLGFIYPSGQPILSGNVLFYKATGNRDGLIKIHNGSLEINKVLKPLSVGKQLAVTLVWLLGLIGLFLLWKSAIFSYKSEDQRFVILFYILGIGIVWVVFKLFFNDFLMSGVNAHQVRYENYFGTISLIDILFDLICIIFVFLASLHPYFITRLARTKFSYRLLLGAFTTATIFFYIFYQSFQFVNKASLNFGINSPLAFGPNELIFSFVLIGYCFLNFYLVTLFFKNQENDFPLNKKVFTFFLPVIGVSLIYLFSLDVVVIATIVIFIFIFLLSFDVFQDIDYRHLSFFVWWVVFHAAFLTFTTYRAAIYRTSEDEKIKLKQSFYSPNQDDINKVKLTTYTIELSNFLKQLSMTADGQTFEYNDFISYIYSMINSDNNGNLGNLQLDQVEFFDNKGKSLFINYSGEVERSKEEISGAKLVGNNLYYRPLPPNYIWYKPVDDSLHLILKYNAKGFSKFQGNYLLYKDGNLVDGQGLDFIKSEIPKFISQDTIIQKFNFYNYKIDSNYNVAAFVPEYGLLRPISLFSLIFILGLLFLGILTFFNTFWNYLPIDFGLRFTDKTSLRLRLQLSIIGLIIFSFTVIGVVTAIYFHNINKQKILQTFDDRVRALTTDINLRLSEFTEKTGATYYLLNQLENLNSIYRSSVQLYDENGQSLSRNNQLDFTPRLPFYVLEQIRKLNKTQSNLGVRSYNLSEEEVLIPLYKNDKSPMAYLSYTQTEPGVVERSEIKNYVGTLLNVYIFLFLLAIAISLGISNSITKPLVQLRESLRQFKIGKAYNKLKWESTDEIGDLINDYNNLTEEINKSANIIARTEREMAWREMAKQVAHEIKNPLTPMKLSLQYLEKAVATDPENGKKMISKITATMMEQINNLTQIANTFSNFASMPKTENEKIILNEVVEKVHDLFRKRDDMDINLIEPMNEIYVFADRNHLVRILNNILKNAIQAIPEDKRGHIDLELTKEKDIARIRISDNGVGIKEEMKSKVFTPNFTTKSSGTGLGLAISANMLETMGGRIYFDSVENTGTSFFIELPLMRTELLADNEVLLDEE
ncbi:MAG: ATP-binding protein [Saprospiraceae bacterium]